VDRLPYPSPRQRALLTPLFRILRAYFRAQAHGLEAIPSDRPVLYVAKHPRCYLYFETMLLGVFTFFDDPGLPELQVMEKRGTSLHRAPILGWIRRNMNTIAATEDGAVEALAAGRSVLVFPGGARELFGPPDLIRWRGHDGFARIAARARAPVIPVAIAGADRQHPWRLRLGRRNTLWLPPLPLPVRLDYWFGAPLVPPPADRPDAVARFADDVAVHTQDLLHVAARAREAVGEARARLPARPGLVCTPHRVPLTRSRTSLPPGPGSGSLPARAAGAAGPRRPGR